MIHFENDVEQLTKAELGTELNLDAIEITKRKKADLLKKFISQNNDAFSRRKIYKKYSTHFALHPKKVQEHLGITVTERKRWTEQGKLQVSHYGSFEKWGKQLEYPMYDAFGLSNISDEMIEKWREEHKQKVSQNRKKATKKSMETRQKNQSIQKEFYEKEWKKLLSKWFSKDGKLGVTLQLAFWTVWVSRWAKEYQAKAYRAITKGDEYNNKKDKFYELKNEAMKLLMNSPHTKLSFYSPPSPNKISNLHFCSNHYELWCVLREFGYIGKWDFFHEYEHEISKCKHCEYDQIDQYYSLYYLSVENDLLQDFHFSFHVPYPIGVSFLPGYLDLKKVDHDEQEGMFRFGRTLFEDEKVIFREKEVLKNFEEARTKFMLYFQMQHVE